MSINEVALTESAELRKQYTNDSVLDRVKVVPFLPDDLHLTTEMVSAFYEVDKKTVESMIKAHRSELETNEYRVLEGPDLRRFRGEFATLDAKVANPVGPKTRHLALFTRRTLLNVGMLLRDSEVAKQVRTYLLEVEAGANQEAREGAAEAAIARLEGKVDALTENLGDYFRIEEDAKGLGLSATADILGVSLHRLIEVLLDRKWIRRVGGKNKYLPQQWAIEIGLVENAPKVMKSSARVTKLGRDTLSKTKF